ncbi:MAG: cytochrome P450 [Opitutaceae bacterium]|nr:cytochrome P450 [Opitutaceae bacterium]
MKPRSSPDPVLDRLLVSDEIMVDPYPIYRRLRETAPVFWSDTWNAWVVSRFDDVGESLRDKENLSNENRQGLLFSGLSEEEREKLAPLRHYFAQKDVIGSDPPDHTRMRALVQKAFTPKTIASLEGRIRKLAESLIGAACSGKCPFDFVHEVAHPLPVILIAELLGAPVEDRPLFKRWSADILAFQGTGVTTFGPAMVSQTALMELFAYMNRLIDERRMRPQDDIITVLALAEENGRGFSRDELLATCNTLLTAGHETTTNLLGNLVHLLLSHPEQWTALKGNPTLIGPAIDEALRFEAPKQRNFRRVKKAHVFTGVPFDENEMVFQLIGSANRDPARIEAPDVFNIHRTKIDHFSFGSGIHFCLGAPLAKLEARVVLETLIARCPGIRLVPGSLKWQERVQFRGPRSLVLE